MTRVGKQTKSQEVPVTYKILKAPPEVIEHSQLLGRRGSPSIQSCLQAMQGAPEKHPMCFLAMQLPLSHVPVINSSPIFLQVTSVNPQTHSLRWTWRFERMNAIVWLLVGLSPLTYRGEYCFSLSLPKKPHSTCVIAFLCFLTLSSLAH